MNKPAAKEPSMDEILSSIRQIIADEDQGTPRKSTLAEEAMLAEDDQDEPLALSPEQMVSAPEPEAAPEPAPVEEPAAEADEEPLSAMTLADDVAFEPDEPAEDPDVESLANMLADTEADVAEEEDEEPGIVLADDIGFDGGDAEPEPEPEPARAAAPMPDRDLSRDVAEKLLEPTTAAASKHAFSRLNKLSMGAGDVTIENMVREMLRPMLKEWLDENLPGVVEKLVEREIERISRGS